MNFNNIKYDRINNFIQEQYDKYQDWEKVSSLSMSGMSLEDTLSFVNNFYLSDEKLTRNLWEKLVNYQRNLKEKRKIYKLSATIQNDAVIPTNKYSSWKLYKNNLLTKGWTDESIADIEQSSIETLRMLSQDTTRTGPVKGLVIGNVQSGKTANMAGLMAMAADNGFNYFVVLSGVIENLRKQTNERLHRDLTSDGSGVKHWNNIENPSIGSMYSGHDISSLDLKDSSNNVYLSVLLKNYSRLEKFIKWILSDSNQAKNIKMLILDDEADQASINTNDTNKDEDRTRINNLLTTLVNTDKVVAMNYIAYTATPYGIVLNEANEESLYPKDFILKLPMSNDYFGPTQLFGVETPEMDPAVDIIRGVPEKDKDIVLEIQKGESGGPLPQSFKDAINWFLISCTAMRELNYKTPISMLIHTSLRIDSHEIIAQKVEEYIKWIRNNKTIAIQELKKLYEKETKRYGRKDLLQGMKNYSSLEKVPNYPSWQRVEKQLLGLLSLSEEEYIGHIPLDEDNKLLYRKGIHLVIDNSKPKATDQIVRLVYPKEQQEIAPLFIVIGGNTLSRGLTLEGLTTTYFLRNSVQADSLMQMGRWFGYRKGYEIFPRIWLDQLTFERFNFISELNEYLRQEIDMYTDRGLSPLEVAPKILQSPNYSFIKITSSNKMQNAKPVDIDFSGMNSQTIYFEDKEERLLHNLETTKSFLNSLSAPQNYKGRLIWRKISTDKVKIFLNQYEVSKSDIRMSQNTALVEWVEKNNNLLDPWTVILSSKAPIDKAKPNDEWNIHGLNPTSVKRTKLSHNATNGVADIKALLSPSDHLIELVADENIQLNKENINTGKRAIIQRIRMQNGLGQTPLLVIYKIDKDSQPTERQIEKGTREALNFSNDVIGINILMPEFTDQKNSVETISVKLDYNNFNYDDLDE